MLEAIVATVVGGVILLVIEYWTEWFSKRAADVRDHLFSDNDSPAMDITPRTAWNRRHSSSRMTSAALAEMVENVVADSSKVDLISSLVNDVNRPISGEDAASILSSFSSDAYTIRALRTISPKLSRPVSGQAALLIIQKISSSSYKADAAEILSMKSVSLQERRRR